MKQKQAMRPRDANGRFRKKPFNLFGLPLELRIEIYRLSMTVDQNNLSPTIPKNATKALRSEQLVSAAQFKALCEAISEFTSTYIQYNILRSSDMLYIPHNFPCNALLSTPEPFVGAIMKEFKITKVLYDRRDGFGHGYCCGFEHGYDCPHDCYCKCEKAIEISLGHPIGRLNVSVWEKGRGGFKDGQRRFVNFSYCYDPEECGLCPLEITD